MTSLILAYSSLTAAVAPLTVVNQPPLISSIDFLSLYLSRLILALFSISTAFSLSCDSFICFILSSLIFYIDVINYCLRNSAPMRFRVFSSSLFNYIILAANPFSSCSRFLKRIFANIPPEIYSNKSGPDGSP